MITKRVNPDGSVTIGIIEDEPELAPKEKAKSEEKPKTAPKKTTKKK